MSEMCEYIPSFMLDSRSIDMNKWALSFTHEKKKKCIPIKMAHETVTHVRANNHHEIELQYLVWHDNTSCNS